MFVVLYDSLFICSLLAIEYYDNKIISFPLHQIFNVIHNFSLGEYRIFIGYF